MCEIVNLRFLEKHRVPCVNAVLIFFRSLKRHVSCDLYQIHTTDILTSCGFMCHLDRAYYRVYDLVNVVYACDSTVRTKYPDALYLVSNQVLILYDVVRSIKLSAMLHVSRDLFFRASSGQIPDMLGVVLSSSKYGVRQARGKYGMGAKMALIWSKKSTGLPIQVPPTGLKMRCLTLEVLQ